MPTLLEKLQSKFGVERVSTFTDKEDEALQVISTGSLSLDFATGLGGIPVGRTVEVFGLPSVGKTSLSYAMIGEHLRAFPDKFAFYINIEGSFDPKWAKTLAPNLNERLIVVHPDPGEESVYFMAETVKSGDASIVVFDSIGAMLGDSEQEVGGKTRAGGQSMLATHMAKLVTVPADRNGTTIILINQARDNFSMYGGIHSPGGWAPKHQAAIRVKLRRTPDNFKAKVHGQEMEVGFRVAAEIVKNKASAPGEVAFWNFYNRPLNYLGDKKVELDPNGKIGIDREQELFDLALGHGIIKQGGAYYTHDVFPLDPKGEHKIKSKDAVFEYLRSNPQDQVTIKNELMELAQQA